MKKRNRFLNAGRKVTMFLISALITTTAITTPIWAENFAIGDINQDKKINSIDMATLKGYLMGKDGFSLIGQRTYEADVNGDSFINSIDLAYVRLYLLGVIETFPKSDTLPYQTYPPTPKGTPTSPPPPTGTPIPGDTSTPVKTPELKPNYVLPVPSEHPDKINTKIFTDAKNLITTYSNDSVTFKVFLVDNSYNPIVGKTVSWNWDPNLGEEPGEKYSAVTDSNGTAFFTITQKFDENNDYNERKRFVNLYFDGDEKYNASVSQELVKVSNNGIPFGGPKPLPSPVLDPDKLNTNIKIYQNVQTTSCYLFTKRTTFSVKLSNSDGEPITGKTVKWVNHGYIVALTNIVDSAVTDSMVLQFFPSIKRILKMYPLHHTWTHI